MADAAGREEGVPCGGCWGQLVGKAWGMYRDTVDGYGDELLQTANPSLGREDRVTRDWPLSSASQASLVLIFYAILVFVVAPVVKLTTKSGDVTGESATDGKRRQPKKRSVMQKFYAEPILFLQTLYNISQVALCSWMILLAATEYRKENYKLICNKFDPSRTGMASAAWIFFISKVLDMLDTVFIVVRRKWSQFSALHIFHHSSIFVTYWINANVAYDGDIYFTIVLNSFVHLVMYFYYFIRTLDIPVPIYLKAAVTRIQMTQFLLMMTQAIWVLVKSGEECPFPNRITMFYLVYIIILFLLFKDFSNRTYRDAKKLKST